MQKRSDDNATPRLCFRACTDPRLKTARIISIGIHTGDTAVRWHEWLAEKLPPTRASIHRVVLSRFTSALSIYVASGTDTDTAMKEAVRTMGHRAISAQLEQARVAMMNPSASKNLAQALAESGAFEPVYARMLIIGARSGSTEEVLGRLSLMFFDDAGAGMDRLDTGAKPTLAVFLTGAMGATLVSVILPLSYEVCGRQIRLSTAPFKPADTETFVRAIYDVAGRSMQLSQVIEAIVSQQLIPTVDDEVVPAFEIMIANTATRNLIREEKTHQLDSVLAASGTAGMRTMDQSLFNLVKSGRVTKEMALQYGIHQEALEKRFATEGW